MSMLTTSKRWLEWLSSTVVYYSGLGRVLSPLHQERGDRVSIVMYHRVHPDGVGPDWWLTQSVFRAQLLHLQAHYNVLPLGEVVEMLRANQPLPERAVSVTFDDGYRDNYTEAFPVIRQTGCPVTIFLTAGLLDTQETLWWDKLLYIVSQTTVERRQVDRAFASRGLPPPAWAGPDVEAAILALKRLPEGKMQEVVDAIAAELGVDPTQNTDDHMMRWSEARAMADSGLVTMGAHTMTHRNLKKLPLEEARREIATSKQVIEEQLERRVELFAYPFGNPANDYTPEVKELVRQAGYTSALTVVFGVTSRGVDLYELPRFCESVERWQGPSGGFSRALFDVYLNGAREHFGDLRPDRWLKRSA